MISLPRHSPTSDFSPATIELFLFYHLALERASNNHDTALCVDMWRTMLVDTSSDTKQIQSNANAVVSSIFTWYVARPRQVLERACGGERGSCSRGAATAAEEMEHRRNGVCGDVGGEELGAFEAMGAVARIHAAKAVNGLRARKRQREMDDEADDEDDEDEEEEEKKKETVDWGMAE